MSEKYANEDNRMCVGPVSNPGDPSIIPIGDGLWEMIIFGVMYLVRIYC
ncbi:MAG: hypothetical protein WCJ61_02390 [Paludibacter sp.]